MAQPLAEKLCRRLYAVLTPVACGGATALGGSADLKQVALETLPRALDSPQRSGSPTPH
ncbi:hypothetical protein [Nostoc sp. T09]|uniref:hypothetical protein n=1 Tax=Nostoc sp. T09 TaxID=1932621 RepID=UPI0015C4EB53|nr:hypothetical protein [Nostoc sp. T09]